MKAIVKTKAAPGFELLDIAQPELTKSNDVKIKVIKSSVCGTDYHIYKWDEWAQKTIPVPHVNGHEVLAEIIEVGSGVTSYKIGDIIACETHIYCGNCYQCRTGNAHVCEHMSILGVHQDGIWAQYQVVPENILWKVDGIDHKCAGVMEPLGNAIHTLSYSELRGRHVLISGAGPIGIMAAYVAVISGAATVSITEINDYRKNMMSAMDIGVNVIDPTLVDLKEEILKITKGHGVDVIAEMTGNEKAHHTACDLIIPGGDINILSVYPTQMVSLPLNDLVFKNIKIQTVTGRKLFDTWSIASEWLRFGQIDGDKLDHVITHEFKIEDFEEAFKLMREGTCGKIILDFTHLS